MKSRFASRPGNAEAWVKAVPASRTEQFSARLTIDVTPELRGRIKIVAFQHGLTVADMLRTLLDREFGEGGGGQ
ncbi:ribbon-helix-helix protein [Sandaracinobacteroides saxicola]|uniref:Plasmid segregation centromere-binding protein ParG n=1 Tax=Sandaracinobacteroides saxicola TaxID=2759707 RepID=A0A7G5IGI4_9SPHN|nr:hypothetical protein [Sandaracinobacteroides saxicola]QMW22476.1 hypothetical protein H3309_14200 [Sandaracinobacteroides saxicola]